jgi:hypothetical protein
MEDRAPGRSNTPIDEEKQSLREQIAELQKKLFVAEKTTEVRDMLHAYELQNAKTKRSAPDQKKRKRRKKQ